MKSTDEMTREVLDRYHTALERKQARRRLALRGGAVAACFCLLAAVGFGFGDQGALRQLVTPQSLTDTEKSGKGEESTVNNGSETASPSNTGEETASSNAFLWNQSDVNGAYLKPGDDAAVQNVIPMLSRYRGEYSDDGVLPTAGTVLRSPMLQAAMDEKGNSVKYQVRLRVYDGAELLPPQSETMKREFKRLSDLGYITVEETLTDADGKQTVLYSLHATYEELATLAPSPSYGYRLSFYEEGLDVAASGDPDASVVFNGMIAN